MQSFAKISCALLGLLCISQIAASQPNTPPPDLVKEVLQWFEEGSPTIEANVSLLRERILDRSEDPWLRQYLLEATLGKLGSVNREAAREFENEIANKLDSEATEFLQNKPPQPSDNSKDVAQATFLLNCARLSKDNEVRLKTLVRFVSPEETLKLLEGLKEPPVSDADPKAYLGNPPEPALLAWREVSLSDISAGRFRLTPGDIIYRRWEDQPNTSEILRWTRDLGHLVLYMGLKNGDYRRLSNHWLLEMDVPGVGATNLDEVRRKSTERESFIVLRIPVTGEKRARVVQGAKDVVRSWPKYGFAGDDWMNPGRSPRPSFRCDGFIYHLYAKYAGQNLNNERRPSFSNTTPTGIMTYWTGRGCQKTLGLSHFL